MTPEDQMGIRLPDKLELYNRGSDIEIVRRWFGWSVILLTGLLPFFWGGALLLVLMVWYPELFGLKAQEVDVFTAVFFVLLTVSTVALAMGLTYSAVAGWLNRTYLSVSRSEIVIRHGPIPSFCQMLWKFPSSRRCD